MIWEASEGSGPSNPAPGHLRSSQLRGSQAWNPGTEEFRGTWKVGALVATAEVTSEAREWSAYPPAPELASET